MRLIKFQKSLKKLTDMNEVAFDEFNDTVTETVQYDNWKDAFTTAIIKLIQNGVDFAFINPITSVILAYMIQIYLDPKHNSRRQKSQRSSYSTQFYQSIQAKSSITLDH